MPNTSTPMRVRQCAGMGIKHPVDDRTIIGMVQVGEEIQLFCNLHADIYELRLKTIGDVPLQM